MYFGFYFRLGNRGFNRTGPHEIIFGFLVQGIKLVDPSEGIYCTIPISSLLHCPAKKQEIVNLTHTIFPFFRQRHEPFNSSHLSRHIGHDLAIKSLCLVVLTVVEVRLGNKQEFPHHRFKFTGIQEKLDRLCDFRLSLSTFPQLKMDSAQQENHPRVIWFNLEDGFNLGLGLIELSALEVVGTQLSSHRCVVGI